MACSRPALWILRPARSHLARVLCAGQGYYTPYHATLSVTETAAGTDKCHQTPYRAARDGPLRIRAPSRPVPLSAYAHATQCPVLTQRAMSISLRACLQIPGTDMALRCLSAYAHATRCPVLTCCLVLAGGGSWGAQYAPVNESNGAGEPPFMGADLLVMEAMLPVMCARKQRRGQRF
eukprot:1217919-Rhodomonas_salina.2